LFGRERILRTASDPAKTMETRFFAPASLVSNLDFVESIFGNGGDPYLPENDAALDVMHWTGHTGCVILAPYLPGIKKKSVGLPHYDEATERHKFCGESLWTLRGRTCGRRPRLSRICSWAAILRGSNRANQASEI